MDRRKLGISFALAAAVMLAVCLLPQSVSASSETDFTYRTDADGGIVITGYVGLGGEVVVPQQIESRPVTTIGREAFNNNGKVVKITLPEGLLRIEDSAFQAAYNLQEAVLPSTLRYLGKSAFNSCGNLKSISIPQGISTIQESAFFRCVSLTQADLPLGLKSIEGKAFSVTGLQRIDLPASLESIGEHAFYGNRYLEEVTLPSTVKTIDEYAFFVCDSLKKVVLPYSLQSMSAGVFDKCPNLEMIAIPMTVKNIRPDALFSGKLRPQKLTIVAPAGSAAEKYASQAGIAFQPAVTTSLVQLMMNGQAVNVQKVAIDLSSENKTLDLQAVTSPETLWPGVHWQSSNSQVASVDASGHVVAYKKGEAVISAIAADGSGTQSSLTLNVANLAKSITITGAGDLYSKGKTTLKAEVLPATADNKKVNWSSSDPSVLTVSGKGQIKAESVSAKTVVNLIATAQDGSGVMATHPVTVYPLVESVRILRDGQPVENKSTIAIDLASDDLTVQLQAENYPSDAMQQMKWESSAKRVAQVDDSGKITGLKKGKAVISASTVDGTRIKFSVNVVVSTLIKDVIISGNSSVGSEQKLKLTAIVVPEDATDKKLVWTSSDESVARVNKNNGEVTARKVDSLQKVVITASARDGSGKTAQTEITVHPSAAAVTVFRDGAPLNGKEELALSLSQNRELQLTASVDPADAMQIINWKSSDERVAKVDDSGRITLLRKGKARITASAADGSRVKASVNLSISD